MTLFLIQFNCCITIVPSFKRERSYIYSADWIKKKTTTINPKNTDDKCFQYAVFVALNYEEIK